MRNVFIIISILACVFVLGYYFAKKDTTTTGYAYYVLIDQTAKSKAVQDRVANNFSQLLNSLKPGDIIAGVGVNENTEQEAVNEFSETMPTFNFITDNEQRHKIVVSAIKNRIQTAVADIINTKATHTDLMGGFVLAGKFFAGSQALSHSRKILIVFSDGIEQSEDYNFTDIKTLEGNGITTIINREKRFNRIPDLSNVEIHMVGVNLALDPQADMTREKLSLVSKFWKMYFIETGSKIDTANYGPSWSVIQ